MPKVKLPALEAREMHFLEPPEVNQLVEAIDAPYRAMVLTAAYTGLRFGELSALRPDRVDFLRKTIRVEESLAEIRGEFIFKRPKSAASRRTVSIPGFLVEEIAQHIAAYPDRSDLLFTAPGGGPIRRNNFRRRTWLPAVEASLDEPCTFHDLRHTHAAFLIAQGEHPKVIQSRLGHASIKITLDTYGHLFDGLDEAAADRLDETWRASFADAPLTRRQSQVIELPVR
jgi:integrase